MFKKKRVKDSAKKIDKLVTTVIIGGAIASIFGMSRTKKGKKVTQKVSSATRGFFSKSFNFLGKGVVHIVKFFQKK